MENKKNPTRENNSEEEYPNLGLDADHSSDGETIADKLNDDNERVSGNPDGEDDDTDNNSATINSPLDEK
ncbi:MAG TPA: hypothetical protein VKB19_14635 [Pedobacter sp.]|nr:hypothetical protein [Pedobacter sp.]